MSFCTEAETNELLEFSFYPQLRSWPQEAESNDTLVINLQGPTSTSSYNRQPSTSLFSSLPPSIYPENDVNLYDEEEKGADDQEIKITALWSWKATQRRTDPIILANTFNVSHLRYFQRSSIKELIFFVGHTVVNRTPTSQHVSWTNFPSHQLNQLPKTPVHELDNEHEMQGAVPFPGDLNRSDHT